MTNESNAQFISNLIENLNAHYEGQALNINGTDYIFNKIGFKKAKKVFSFALDILPKIEQGDIRFFSDEKFENEIEPILLDHILVKGMQVSKSPNYWDDHRKDYILVMISGLLIVCHPFG